MEMKWGGGNCGLHKETRRALAVHTWRKAG